MHVFGKNPKSQAPNPKSQFGRLWLVGLLVWVLGFGIWDLGFAFAQGRGGARGGGGAGDPVRQVLYDIADSIGMLRQANEVDRIGSMNYWATGTVMTGGQSCK